MNQIPVPKINFKNNYVYLRSLMDGMLQNNQINAQMVGSSCYNSWLDSKTYNGHGETSFLLFKQEQHNIYNTAFQ